MGKPLFNTAFGAFETTQQARPPVRFDGVTANVFPLRANIARLRAFCSDYLNVAPDVVHFRPAVPWVYLMVLDYGRMAARAENFGWVAQHEIAFAVVLEWYVRRGEQWQFVDWATVCPYIFVDNEMSLSTGREVYGWPKVRVTLEPDVAAWVSDPMAPQSLLTASAPLFPELYAGQRPAPEVFLRIRQQAPPWRTRFPPDPDRFDPLAMVSRAIGGFWGGFGRLMDMAGALPIRGYPRDAVGTTWSNVLSRGAKYVTAFGAPPPRLNNITLKQFRDAEEPALVCYQSITNSVMKIRRFNGGGMLGDAGLFVGDTSGGIDVMLRRSASLPIVDALGLEARHEGAGQPDMVSLRPVLPFWQNVDLEYGSGETVCWRTKRSGWVTDRAVGDVPESPPGGDPPHNRFNTARGVGAQDVVGPFEFPNTTVRVLPLLADHQKLHELCSAQARQLAPDCPVRIEPWGSYVYLGVSSFGAMSSPNDVGWWAERELTFFVPVRLFPRDETVRTQSEAAPRVCPGDDTCPGDVPPTGAIGAALMPVFAFADPQMAAVVEREVNGRPTLGATIGAPPGRWLSDAGPGGDNDTLVTLDTLMLPALNLGQQAEWKRLLAVSEVDALPGNDVAGWGTIVDRWVGGLKLEVARKVRRAADAAGAFDDARDLAVGMLGGRIPLNVLSLKQFRDVVDSDCACYQALVLSARVIRRVSDLREIESRLHLRIRRNPAIDVVGLLGLRVKCTETTAAGVVDVVQPLRPFWADISMREELGHTLCWRTGEAWHRTTATIDAPASIPPRLPDDVMRPARPSVVLDADPQLIDAVAMQFEGPQPIDVGAVLARTEPQLVIESMLSNEWGDCGNPRWDRQNRMKAEYDKAVSRWKAWQELKKASEGNDPHASPGGYPPTPEPAEPQSVPKKPTFCIPCHTLGEPGLRETQFGTAAASGWWYVVAKPHLPEDVWFPPPL